jgi:hypothetical protein
MITGLNAREKRVFAKLREPRLVQDFIDFELKYKLKGKQLSPAEVISRKQADCFDGALFAAACLWFHGRKPLLVALNAERDEDHAIAIFREGKKWGSIAQSKFTGLRYRDAVYSSLRELVMSYFDAYYNFAGQKTLHAYTIPLNLRKFGSSWVTDSGKTLSKISDSLCEAREVKIISGKEARKLRLVDAIQFKAQVKGNSIKPFSKQKREAIFRQLRKKRSESKEGNTR